MIDQVKHTDIDGDIYLAANDRCEEVARPDPQPRKHHPVMQAFIDDARRTKKELEAATFLPIAATASNSTCHDTGRDTSYGTNMPVARAQGMEEMPRPLTDTDLKNGGFVCVPAWIPRDDDSESGNAARCRRKREKKAQTGMRPLNEYVPEEAVSVFKVAADRTRSGEDPKKVFAELGGGLLIPEKYRSKIEVMLVKLAAGEPSDQIFSGILAAKLPKTDDELAQIERRKRCRQIGEAVLQAHEVKRRLICNLLGLNLEEAAE